MLKELTVQNFALLKELHLGLDEGLTVLTGSTGAGKSIVVGAIGLLLGERAGAHLVRRGASATSVEGVFDLSSRGRLIERLAEMGLEAEDGLVVLKRLVSHKGDSKAFLNGSRLTVSQLTAVGDLLVDLHGQHDHQSLLRPAHHLDLLDDYGQLRSLRKQAREGYRMLEGLHQEEVALSGDVQLRRDRREFLEYQLDEIERCQPREGEDEDLEKERRILENIEELFEGLKEAYQVLFEDEDAVIERLSIVRSRLEALSRIDNGLAQKGQECTTLVYQLEELAAELRNHLQSLQPDPQRLAEIVERHDELQRLKKKHGGSIAAVKQRQQEIAEELEALTTGDQRLEKIRGEIRQGEQALGRLCEQLSASRSRVAGKLSREVERRLKDLGMPGTRFAVDIQQQADDDGWAQTSDGGYRCDVSGMDRVQFLISPNPGEGFRPLSKIASGGEISRIMLAMKSILAGADQVPLLVFDEIDVGIGGQVAEAVGQSLRSLGRTHQVLCITHLHQIACLAQQHYSVSKKQRGGRTETIIQRLSPREREGEIARMMGGKEITPITLEHAREMMRQRGRSQANS
jgi:DNA repair protein RecN (Recombination protein N)